MFKIFEIEIRICLICLTSITSVCVYNLHLFKRFLLVDFHSFSLKSQSDMVIFLKIAQKETQTVVNLKRSQNIKTPNLF